VYSDYVQSLIQHIQTSTLPETAKKTKSQRRPGNEPVERQEVGDPLAFEGGNKTIIAAVKQGMTEKVSEVIEVESDEDEVSRAETLGCVSGSKR